MKGLSRTMSATFLTYFLMSITAYTLGYFAGTSLLTTSLILGAFGIFAVIAIYNFVGGSGSDKLFTSKEILSFITLILVAILCGWTVSFGGL